MYFIVNSFLISTLYSNSSTFMRPDKKLSGYLWTTTSTVLLFFFFLVLLFISTFSPFSSFFSPILPALWKFNSTGRGREFEADTEIALRYIVNFAINPARPRAPATRKRAALFGRARWKLLLTTTNISRARIFAYNSVWFNRSRWQLSIFPIRILLIYDTLQGCKASSRWKKAEKLLT